jgi:hypothetical protein
MGFRTIDATRQTLVTLPLILWQPLGEMVGFFVERLSARASMQPI